jgi:hypothetical protein
VNKEEDHEAMDRNALYYALSTIAMVAAALAALIGFLGMWRLDRLRDEMNRIEPDLLQLISQTSHLTPQVQIVGADRPDIRRVPQWELSRAVDNVITDPKNEIERQIKPELEYQRKRQREIPGEYSCLRLALVIFLMVTLVGILAPAIVVGIAACSSRALLTLLLLLALASPALAGPVRCTTYEEKTLGRLQTLCDDGTRAVSTYNRTLDRWDTTVTPPPGQRCTGALNPRTRQWEGRCR